MHASGVAARRRCGRVLVPHERAATCSSRCSARRRAAGPGWAPRRSLTCMSCMTGVCVSCGSRRVLGRPCSTCSIAARRGLASGDYSDGQYLAMSLSGAEEEMELLRRAAARALSERSGGVVSARRDAVGAQLSRQSRARCHVSRARPGTEALRPGRANGRARPRLRARGRTRAGRRRWRVPCSAVTPRRGRRLSRT